MLLQPRNVGRLQQQNERDYINQQVELPPYIPPTYKHIGKAYPFRNIKAAQQRYLHYQKPNVTSQAARKMYKVVNSQPFNKSYGNPLAIEKYQEEQGDILKLRDYFQNHQPDNSRFFTTQAPVALPPPPQQTPRGVPPLPLGPPPTKPKFKMPLPRPKMTPSGGGKATGVTPPPASTQPPRTPTPLPRQKTTPAGTPVVGVSQPPILNKDGSVRKPRGRPKGSKNQASKI